MSVVGIKLNGGEKMDNQHDHDFQWQSDRTLKCSVCGIKEEDWENTIS
jgi:hypothetical protein